MFSFLKRKDKNQNLNDIDEIFAEINKTKEKVKKSPKDIEKDIERSSMITKHRFTL